MLDRKRLAQICEMLRSDNDNERAVAARMATDLLRRAEVTWTDVILGGGPQQPSKTGSAPSKSDPSTAAGKATSGAWPDTGGQKTRASRATYSERLDAKKIVTELLRRSTLSNWEKTFLNALVKQMPYSALTERQWKVVKDIALKHGVI
jgi:hypothetical protein